MSPLHPIRGPVWCYAHAEGLPRRHVGALHPIRGPVWCYAASLLLLATGGCDIIKPKRERAQTDAPRPGVTAVAATPGDAAGGLQPGVPQPGVPQRVSVVGADGSKIDVDGGRVRVTQPDGTTLDLQADAAGGAACQPGQPCTCSGMGTCSRTCTGPGCAFVCESLGTCNFDCPKGGCTVRSSGTGTTNLACAGGGCSLSCAGVGACNLTQCPRGCRTSCTGVGTCACKTGC